MIKTYPISVSNTNVPKNVYLLADISTMSGEIHTTYYADKDYNLLKVSDWVNSKPSKCSLHEICKITGDTEGMVTNRIESYFFFNQ